MKNTPIFKFFNYKIYFNQSKFLSQSDKINRFYPKKLNVMKKIKDLETLNDKKNNPLFPRTSLLENSPTKEEAVIKMIKNKNVVYPKQHPKLFSEPIEGELLSLKDKTLPMNKIYDIPQKLYLFQEEKFEQPVNPRSIEVGVVGPTNSGKSSLINALTNSNLSAVSSKANTTFQISKHIFTEDSTQLIFFDTPGAFRANKQALISKNIITSAWTILSEVDKVLFVVDSVKRLDRVTKLAVERFFSIKNTYISRKVNTFIKSKNNITVEELGSFIESTKNEFQDLKKKMIDDYKKDKTFDSNTNYSLEKLKDLNEEDIDYYLNSENEDVKFIVKKILDHPLKTKEHIPAVLVLNKIDLVSNKRKLKNLQDELESLGKFDKVFHVSSKSNFGLDELKNYLKEESFRRDFKFNPNTLTNRSDVEKCEELLRQHLLRRSFKELPYECLVELKSWVPLTNGTLSLIFHIETKNRITRKILIGRDGLNLKEIHSSVEFDLSEAYGRKVKVEIVITLRKSKNIHKLNKVIKHV